MARMAMISLETVIWKPDSISKPSMGPPRPIVMVLSACAQKSIAHFIWTRAGSTFSRFSPLRASRASS